MAKLPERKVLIPIKKSSSQWDWWTRKIDSYSYCSHEQGQKERPQSLQRPRKIEDSIYGDA